MLTHSLNFMVCLKFFIVKCLEKQDTEGNYSIKLLGKYIVT